MKEKNCRQCNTVFVCKSLKARWCSIKCKNLQYKIKYPEKVASQLLAWQRANKEKIKLNKEIPTNKIAANLRSRLSKALSRRQKTVSMSEYLGCTLLELKVHLESKFQPGMNWDNYGSWHIDHIKPLSSFDLTNKEELKMACGYHNLQPLWEFDNKSKGGRYV